MALTLPQTVCIANAVVQLRPKHHQYAWRGALHDKARL